jgi:xylose isomerase
MRSYLILRDKARRFAEDPEIQAALAAAQVDRLGVPTLPETGEDRFTRLRRETTDIELLAAQAYGHERLDQLVTELLLGVR